jgi:hypothetical protein
MHLIKKDDDTLSTFFILFYFILFYFILFLLCVFLFFSNNNCSSRNTSIILTISTIYCVYVLYFEVHSKVKVTPNSKIRPLYLIAIP